MESFRREPRKPLYMVERPEIRRIRPPPPQPLIRQRFEPYETPYLEEVPETPIRRRRVLMPKYYEEDVTSHADNNRSYQSSEPDTGPKPLLPPETIEKLRANLNMINQTLNRYERQNREHYENRYRERERYEVRYQEQYDDQFQEQYDDRYDDRYEEQYEEPVEEVIEREPYQYEPRPGPSSVGREVLEPNDYVQEEEEVTKKTIEEIIMVAQALRDKLEQRQSMTSVPETRAPQPPIEFFEEGCEPVREGRRPPLLKTPNIPPMPVAPKPPMISNTFKKGDKLPSLLQMKAKKIPSLLELQVEPPTEVEYIQEHETPYNDKKAKRDICWNCNKVGHRHEVCWFPPKEFCYRCGTQGVNEETCPNCPE